MGQGEASYPSTQAVHKYFSRPGTIAIDGLKRDRWMMETHGPPATAVTCLQHTCCAGTVLRIGIAVTALSFAWSIHRQGSAVGTSLFMEWDLPEQLSTRVDTLLMLVLAMCGVGLLFRPARVLLVVVAVVMGLLTMAMVLNRGEPGSDLIPLRHGVLYLAPAALLLVLPERCARPALGWFLLRIGIAMTFAGHGWSAFAHHPAFIDLIIGSGSRLPGMAISEKEAEIILGIVGAVDLLAAILICTCRSRIIAGYMVAWGLGTSLSRVTHTGLDAWNEPLLRVLNWAAPLAIMISWWAEKNSPAHAKPGRTA